MFPYVNEKLYASSDSEPDGEDVDELSGAVSSVNVIQFADDAISDHLSKMKLDEENLAVKTASSCSTVEHHPTDLVEVDKDGSVVLSKRISDFSLAWRSDLSRTHVWYASFGSNMWKPRFLCYIQGGKVKFKTQCFCKDQRAFVSLFSVFYLLDVQCLFDLHDSFGIYLGTWGIH